VERQIKATLHLSLAFCNFFDLYSYCFEHDLPSILGMKARPSIYR
jgi:hypothetical protein